ncbi:MAG: DEAD/DEAH box helicase [Actinomycetota bacterium]
MSAHVIEEFSSRYSFAFDPFQVEALEALVRGESVLVAAPTGSGKTVIGEFAVWMALEEDKKAFYTTPLKALSNQKFADLSALHGPDNVGLLTGDNSINPEATIVVMTTEVLRNMIYERSDLLKDLGYVVLDEVHYLQDQYRGAVWEEVIIHLPLDVKIVSLSATVSNADEFSDWIQTLRGPTTAVIEQIRPVQLEPHYLLAGVMYPMFVGEESALAPNPQVARLESDSYRSRARRGRSKQGRQPQRPRFPHRSDVIELLAEQQMLPAIYFIFSRKGCNAAVGSCMREGLVLTDGAERAHIREHARLRCEYLDPADLEVLGYSEWIEALAAGFAAHHAGLIPAFKEAVEELFQAGLVKVTFATETLSLGINMPARTVVIESLNKFNGERHEILTAGQFTQLTGRAGRRGIDSRGHAVVPEQREIPFSQIAALAGARTNPLMSSFQPSYNMATNLVRNYSRAQADHLLNSSFAQYRADKDVVVLEQLIERNSAYVASYREKMDCDMGDFSAYWKLHDKSRDFEKRVFAAGTVADRQTTRKVLSGVKPGHVLLVTSGKLQGPIVVVGAQHSKRGDPLILALTANRRFARLGLNDFAQPPTIAGNLESALKAEELASHGKPRLDGQSRRRLAQALDQMDLGGNSIASEQSPQESEAMALRAAVLGHPCHPCPDRERHAQWAERAVRLDRENSGLKKKVRARTETLSRRFEKILRVLAEYGYVDDFNLTSKGWRLARIYNENDLLVAEVLNKGFLAGLNPAELAAVASTFVFQSRGPFEVVGTLPTSACKRVYGRVVRLGERVRASEAAEGLEMTRGIEAGFADYAYRWCRGEPLENLVDEDSPPGDFIRSSKQTIDLLRQIKGAEEDQDLSKDLGLAIDGMNRGVVAYTGLL